jgi:mannosylglucosylglycerate synthase
VTGFAPRFAIKGDGLKRIAILHYAGPPTVGGVESTIAYHAASLSKLGYQVRIISGTQQPEITTRANTSIETYTSSLFSSTDQEILQIKAWLDRGEVPDTFQQLVERITKELELALDSCDVCIAHNVLSLNKNLPLSTALARLHAQNNFKLISWSHDLAWTNEQYRGELYEAYPWQLLSNTWPNTTYVTVSEPRRKELATLLDVSPESIHVVVPGVDLAKFFHWTPVTQRLGASLRLLDADGILLLPARITRRKNIALGLRILAEVRRQSGRDFRLIVTGPPGPHNPSNPGYLGELLALSQDLKIEPYAHFLYAYGQGKDPLIPDDDTMSNLYQLSDALLFPSTQEGFGIPMLEAGIAGLPIFCSDIPALRTTGLNDANYFDPFHDSPSTIANRLLSVLDSSAAARLRVRVRQLYRWDAIIREQVVPLLETP